MAGGLGVLFGKDPLNLSLEDQISFAAQVIVVDHRALHNHHNRITDDDNQILMIIVMVLERMNKKQQIGEIFVAALLGLRLLGAVSA